MSAEIVALTGGVGGAKLALGLSKVLSPEQLTLVANTADDFEHLGLSISPDLDTLMYTLAGLNNSTQGWGLEGESWNAMRMLGQYGAEDWFQLGDKDLATHLARTRWLSQGLSLTEVTARLCRQLDIAHTVLPMTDDPVRTKVQTSQGELDFQHYFVREQCRPSISGIRFDGIELATAQSDFLSSLQSSALKAVIICPSNPFVSVRPILDLPEVRRGLVQAKVPVIAVSPIVAGNAIKGPAAKMMNELGMPSSVEAVAAYYEDILDGLVIDVSDSDQVAAIKDLGIQTMVAPTVMRSLDERISLANHCLDFVESLSAS